MTSHPKAYDIMWQRLDNKYCNVGLNIQSFYSQLSTLTRVQDNNMRGLVKFVNQVELCYGQLAEVGHVDSLTMVQVDELCDLLPVSFRWEWMEKYKQASEYDQLHPFSLFMRFLEVKRDIATRLAERAASGSSAVKTKKTNAHGSSLHVNNESKSGTCIVHTESNHSLDECKKFLSMSNDEKYEVLKANHSCFRCLKKHPRNKCQGVRCSICKRNNHHTLLCRSQINSTPATLSASSNHSNTGSSLLPIQNIPMYKNHQVLTVFFDGGSNASFITHEAAQRCHAKRLRPVKLDLTTTGNIETTHDSYIYEVVLRSHASTPLTIKHTVFQE